MGQIVFNGQKPKYCNKVAITTGSKKNVVLNNGEIWLVDSSDADKGQYGCGLYDSYIKGDGSTAAKDLVIYTLNSPVIIDAEPTMNSGNPVSSGGVYTALQDVDVDVDSTPTSGSDNPVSSNGVYSALLGKQDTILDLSDIREGASLGSTALQPEDIEGKQDVLTFDNTPTENSNNPVTSKGIKTALDAKASASDLNTANVNISANSANISNLQQLYTALTQSDIVPVAAADWPLSSLSQNTIYRVQGTSEYYDYMYNGTDAILMATYNNSIDNVPVADSANLVKSGGVYEAVSLENEISLSGYSTVNYTLLDTNKWGTSTNYKHICVPVIEGRSYHIAANASYGTTYAFFTSNASPTAGGNAPVVSGTTRTSVSANGNAYVTIPSTCTYLYLYSGNTSSGGATSALPNLYIISKVKDVAAKAVSADNQNLTSSEQIQARKNLGFGNGELDETLSPYSSNLVNSKTISDALSSLSGRSANYSSRYLYSDGTTISSSTWIYGTEYIEVNEGDTIVWHPGDTKNDACLVRYDSEKAVVSYAVATAAERSFTVSSGIKYIRASYSVEHKDEAFLSVNGKIVWRPLEAKEGAIAHVVDSLTSTSTSDALSANQGNVLATDKRLKVIGNNSTIVYASWRGLLIPGHCYRLYLLNKDFDTSGDTLTSTRTRLCIRFKRDDDENWTTRFDIQTNVALKDYYDFRVTAGSPEIRFQIYLRATKGEAVYFLLSDITNDETNPTTESMYRSIYEQNPTREMFPKMIALAKKHYDTTNSKKPLVLAHISDAHSGSTQYSRFVAYANWWKEKGYVHEIIDTGDITGTTYDAEDINWRNNIDGIESVLTVIGNHDTAANYNDTAGWQAHSSISSDTSKRQDVYNRFLLPYVDNWGVTQPENAATNGYCYWYKDYSGRGLRLIGVDVMGYDATQHAWLEGLLADAITNNYHVAILAHFCGEVMSIIPCNYSSLLTSAGTRSSLDTYNAYVHNMPIAVDAFQNNEGVFVGYFTGHFHRDLICHVTEYPNQLVFSVSSGGVATIRDFTKVAATKTLDDFQFIGIDTYSKLVKLVKVGCDTDIYMRKKSTLSVSYETHQVVGEGM